MENINGTLYILKIEINTNLITKLYFDKEKSGKTICENLNKYMKSQDNCIIIYHPYGPIKYKYNNEYKYLRNECLKNNYALIDLTPEIYNKIQDQNQDQNQDKYQEYRFKINKMTVKTELTNIINTNNKNKLNSVNTVIFRDRVYIPKYSTNKFETVQNIMNLINN